MRVAREALEAETQAAITRGLALLIERQANPNFRETDGDADRRTSRITSTLLEISGDWEDRGRFWKKHGREMA